jgi:DNA polymerase III epsilon subunit-like protein
MSKLYAGMTHLAGNLLAAVDFETTGRRPGYHEIVQIAILPLDHNLDAHPDVPVFYMNIRPNHPERCERGAFAVHGLDVDLLMLHAPSQDRAVDLLCEWFNKLDLPQNRVVVPLAHNWPFESAFLKGWLGIDLVDQMFHSHGRDSMLLAAALNDRAFFTGEPIPFSKLSLIALCKQFGIVYEKAHDALADCQATAELYKRLLTYAT